MSAPSATQNKPSVVREAFASVLARTFTDSMKRAILFASLAASQDGPRFSKEMIHKLNKVMVLANSDQPLEIPVMLSRVIWSGDRGDQVLYAMTQCKTQDEAVEHLMSVIPNWLRYGNLKGMREDLMKMVRSSEFLVVNH
jgi:hypothetical protein